MATISIGIILHKESIHIFQGCLSSLDRSLQEANSFAELICIYTEFSIENHASKNLSQHFFSQFKNFSKIVLIPLLPSQNSISFKRNLVLGTAKGKYLYFTDPDVVHSSSMFKEFFLQLPALQEKNCFGLTGPFKQRSESWLINIQISAFSSVAGIFGLAFQGTDLIVLKVDHAPCAHLFLDKEKVQNVGGFSEKFEIVGEDLDLSHRISNVGGYYCFTRATTTHSLPGYFECYRKFYNYGRAQILVQIQNGSELIRWYRIFPLVAGSILLALGVLDLIFIGVGIVFSISVLGSYYFGMVSATIVEFSKRLPRYLQSLNAAK